MAIFDAVERTLSIVKANFDADMAALVATKVTALSLSQADADAMDQGATIYERLDGSEFSAHADDDEGGLPGIGVYPGPVTTQAKWQQRRAAKVTIVLDYVAIGADPVILGKQSELAVEALWKSIDRIPEAAPAGELGAGELEDSITSVPIGSSRVEGQDFYEDRWTITFPILEEDSGL